MRMRETKDDHGKDWYQILAILSMGVSFCSIGTMFAWTSPSIPILTSEEFPGNITLEEASYLTVIPPVGAIIGSFVFSSAMDTIGRKQTMLLIAAPQIFAWIIVMFAESIYLFYISRFLFGLADGGVYTITPTYMSEVTTPSVRGSWGNFLSSAIYCGFFFVNILGGYCDIRTTAYVFVALPILYLLSFSLMPESPYYLIMNQREEEARKSLQVLRRKKNVEDELKQLMSDVQRQSTESGSWKDLFVNPTNRKAFTAGTFVRAAQQFSGTAAFSTYTAYFFQQAGADISATVSSMIYTLLTIVMNLVSSTILDKLGRRLAMIISSAGCAVILISIAIFFFFKDHTDLVLSYVTWFPVLGMFLYVVTFSIGFGIVPNLFIGEVFSTSIKSKGVCALNIMFAIYEGVITKLFQHLSSNHGMLTPFLLFGGSCILSTILSFYIVPETKGKTLEEIQQSMKSMKETKNGTAKTNKKCPALSINELGVDNRGHVSDEIV